MLSTWLADLARLLADVEVPPSCAVWLFGSALCRSDPEDIDLLILYQEHRMHDGRSLRDRLIVAARRLGLPPLDFVLLSSVEEACVRFALHEGAVRVQPA